MCCVIFICYFYISFLICRPEEKIMKGKDRERAYLATIRSNLARFNFTKFKNVVDAFNFYDKVNKNS